MGILTFSLNVTLDGCVDHREGIADDETHAFFTRLMDEGGAMLRGRVTSAAFVVGGQSFMGYNGGAYFSFSEAISLFVDCEDHAEVDEYWDKLVNAGASPTAYDDAA